MNTQRAKYYLRSQAGHKVVNQQRFNSVSESKLLAAKWYWNAYIGLSSTVLESSFGPGRLTTITWKKNISTLNFGLILGDTISHITYAIFRILIHPILKYNISWNIMIQILSSFKPSQDSKQVFLSPKITNNRVRRWADAKRH